MRALDGVRLGSDGIGLWKNIGREPVVETRNGDRRGGRLAAGFDTRGAVGSRRVLCGSAANSVVSMPPFHTVRRIACLQPSATVILDALGALGRVVACTRYCADVVPAVADGSRIDSRRFVDGGYGADRRRSSLIS